MFSRLIKPFDHLKIEREDFVSAVSIWLRWSGHTLPFSVFTDRFPLPAGLYDLQKMKKAAAVLGLYVNYGRNRQSVSLTPQNFPVLAVFENGHVVACQGVDANGDLIFSGAPAANLISNKPADVICWISVKIDPRRLHEEIFGATGAAGDWFWKPFKSNWWAYLQGALAAGVINVLSIIGALYSMQVYDRVLPSKASNTLVVLTVGVLIVYVLDFALRSLRAYMIDYAGKKVDLKLSDAVFSQGIGIRMEARPQHTGTFISQLREHESIREFLMSTTIFVLSDIPFLLIFIFVIWLIAGQLIYVPLIVITLVLLVAGIIQWPLARYSIEHVKETNARSGLLIESIEGAETLKTLNAEWRMKKRWRELTELLSNTSLKVKALTNLGGNIASSAQQVMYVGVIAYGAILVQRGELTAGALMACSILSSRAIAPITQLVGIITRIHHMRASSRVLDKIMAMPVDRPVDVSYLSLQRHAGSYNLSNIEFSYLGSDIPVLQIHQLQISAGERVAILGRTGSGKSTLLRMLSGLYMPTKGRILMDDVDIHQIDPTRFRSAVGYMTQDVKLFAGTLKENLFLGAGVVDDDKLIAVSAVTGIDRYVKAHHKGYDLPVYEGGGGMSGGQRQAVGLARMMLSDPKVFLLDEPTASMDQQTEREFIDRFKAYIPKESTLVVVTHKPSILALVDRIIIIEQGRVFMDGKRDEILSRLSGKSENAESTV